MSATVPQTRAFPVGATSDMAAVGYVSAGKYPQLNLLQARRDGENGQEPAQSMFFAGKKQLDDIRTAIDWILEAAAPAPEPTAAPAPESAEQLFWNNRPAAAMRALNDVKAERYRQMVVEGWTAQHDDQHGENNMATAAACYALASQERGLSVQTVRLDKLWEWTGWSASWFKPKDKRSNLIRAAALLLAEIERLDLATAKLEQAK